LLALLKLIPRLKKPDHMTESAQFARPGIQVLDQEQILKIHHYSLHILETTGIRVEAESARSIFRESGGARLHGELVYLQADLIERAIKMAPSSVEIFSKSGSHAFHLGQEQGRDTHFGIGVTNTWFQEPESGQIVPFARKHTQLASRLGELLENFAMVSTPGVLSDVPLEHADLYATLDMYASTDKPLVLLISGEGKLGEVLELLSTLHGDISDRPFCIPYVNPITPLVLNRETSDKMITAIRHKLPLMFSNYGMYGGSTPVTRGGTLALLNAELLAGLVFSQLVKEGSQVILGSLPAAFNMKSMGSYYTPASYLLNLACAEMMAFYRIPHCGTSGSNNGRGADLMASENLWLNHLSSCLGKVGCAPFVGGNFESLVFSPATVVLSDHIISEARAFAEGIDLGEGQVNLEEIDRMGHGGNYFTANQTLSYMAGKGSTNHIWDTIGLEAWRERGMPSAEMELMSATREVSRLAMKENRDSLELIEQGNQYIQSLHS
jgi:trimethylamine--corrinoid protein Co-methyltransferase